MTDLSSDAYVNIFSFTYNMAHADTGVARCMFNR